MPDRRRHRGPHPEDRRLFDARALPALREAVADLSHLFTRGYAEKSALKLVGDRYQLTARQRTAVLRSSCSDQALAARRERRVALDGLRGSPLSVDAYNVLITIESALSGAAILRARDGCFRDLASLHGSYRSVEETLPALEKIGEVLADLRPSSVTWFIDAPVSNSGRFASTLREIAGDRGWPWEAEIVPDPDAVLESGERTAASSDSRILDGAGAWVNLAREVIERKVRDAWVVEMTGTR